jgi:hypothetical protein
MSDVLDGLDLVGWDQYAQPAWNAVGEVAASLLALADGGDPDRWRSYNRVLYALGNNHAGKYFPVVVPTLPFLGQILRGSALIARLRALDVLIDIVGSFEPEPGHEEIEDETGRRPLKVAVLDAAAQLSTDIERIHRHPGSDEEARLSGELLAHLGG